jgi:hypothetical protein
MAHHSEHIPWHVFPTHFKYIRKNTDFNLLTNIFPQYLGNQRDDLKSFSAALASKIVADSVDQRLQYPKVYEPRKPEEVVITDEVLARIMPFLTEAGLLQWNQRGRFLDPSRRDMSAFLHKYENNDCYDFAEVNGKAHDGLAMLETLLLSGEMDAIFRICCHQDIDVLTWYDVRQCQCMSDNEGWGDILHLALKAYICLNVLFCFPELQADAAECTPEMDYRHTKAYQSMLKATTGHEYKDYVHEPYRNFFGISFEHFHYFADDKLRAKWLNRPESAWYSWKKDDWRAEYPAGIMSFEDFLAFENEPVFLTTADEVEEVHDILQDLGLPAELRADIIQKASYKTFQQRCLPIAHDPLHPRNRDKLNDVLEDCWRILVRCDMFVRALRSHIAWEDAINVCIVDLFGPPQRGRECTGPRMYENVRAVDAAEHHAVNSSDWRVQFV